MHIKHVSIHLTCNYCKFDAAVVVLNLIRISLPQTDSYYKQGASISSEALKSPVLFRTTHFLRMYVAPCYYTQMIY